MSPREHNTFRQGLTRLDRDFRCFPPVRRHYPKFWSSLKFLVYAEVGLRVLEGLCSIHQINFLPTFSTFIHLSTPSYLEAFDKVCFELETVDPGELSYILWNLNLFFPTISTS